MKRLIFLIAMAASAENVPLQFDAAKTTVEFTLPSTLHTVHGSFALKPGAVAFDPAANTVTGNLVVDAASGKSGNDSRDHRMHKDILESARYPEIVFSPDHFTGELHRSGDSQVSVHGLLRLHGSDHEIELPMKVHMDHGSLAADAELAIPYVKWGLKNPGNLLLHVSDTVTLHIHAVGMTPGG